MTPKELDRRKTQAHEKDTRASIARDFSASRMNTTKWAEAAECLLDLPVHCRVKFVDVPDQVLDINGMQHVTQDYFDSSLNIFTSISIEWLEVNPIEKTWDFFRNPIAVDHSQEIEKRLTALSVPYHWENGFIRIVGHVRKGASQ